ncbi:MAG TPA: hypothetical protein VFO70_06350, partial [Chitinophagaceae bacterium]|nr:hypothetical protein [Chitinophagaceae bacterium]
IPISNLGWFCEKQNKLFKQITIIAAIIFPLCMVIGFPQELILIRNRQKQQFQYKKSGDEGWVRKQNVKKTGSVYFDPLK